MINLSTTSLLTKKENYYIKHLKQPTVLLERENAKTVIRTPLTPTKMLKTNLKKSIDHINIKFKKKI